MSKSAAQLLHGHVLVTVCEMLFQAITNRRLSLDDHNDSQIWQLGQHRAELLRCVVQTAATIHRQHTNDFQ